ncbi:MAG TPA: hypothetical protein VF928_10280 [Usitatibacteraceae bacterium]
MASSDIMEQYKALIGDLGNIGARYTTANGFYLSVVTALLGVMALAESGKTLHQVNFLLLIFVSVFAMVICFIWAKTVEFYGGLFGAKFAVLKLIELQLPVQAYELESDDMRGRGLEPLTRNEIKVPRILGAFFMVLALLWVGLWWYMGK